MTLKSQKTGRKKPRKKSSKQSKTYSPKAKRRRRLPTRKARPRIIDPTNPHDRAVARMKAGSTRKAAAQAEGLSDRAVRNFVRKNVTAKWKHGKWEIKDPRAVYTLIFEDGRLQSFPFRKKAASRIGKFWNAVNEALVTNDPSHLAPFRDVRDAYNKYHVFDTDLNALRRADSIGDLAFHTLYDQTVN